MTLIATSLALAGALASVLALTSAFAGMLAFRVELKGVKPRGDFPRQAPRAEATGSFDSCKARCKDNAKYLAFSRARA